MPRLNQVTMIGNLATEPYLSATQKGDPKLSFRLAVPRPPGSPRKFRQSADGPAQEVPDFVGIMLTGPQTLKTHAYLRQGSQVLVHGSLVSRDDHTLTQDLGRPFEVVEVWAEGVEYLSNIEWDRGRAFEAQQQHG
jgi:single-stranded DNA-binding protein